MQEQVWAGYGANSSAGVLDEYTYGYNPAGEVAYRQNVTAGSADLDQAYQYDQMGQLQSLSQGRVNTATDLIMSGTQNFTQSWGLDGLGNWSQFDESGSGVATVDAEPRDQLGQPDHRLRQLLGREHVGLGGAGLRRGRQHDLHADAGP